HGNLHTPVPGLREFPPPDRPPVNIVFQTYHAMVGIGMGLIGLSLLGLFLWWRGALFVHRPWLFALFILSALGPQAANQLGWFSAEMGRQPWLVYGLLRTADGLSKNVAAGQVLFSLFLFSAVYLLLGAAFLFLLLREIHHGPDERTA
ncbi:MAG TPA: cytochrome ubiquinol oxidase subunit I, partial [Elusimicrobiota bacterium]|nr:cytochrome ubiquinol oxidase subunit I [Elusimicrobiota bacterium]